MKKTYKPKGVCSKEIRYEVQDGVIIDVEIIGGCDGNLKGICSLVKGCPVSEVIQKLEGIDCGGRGTSCPDQLAKALREIDK